MTPRTPAFSDAFFPSDPALTDRVHNSIIPSEDTTQRDAIKKLLTAPSPDGGMRFFEKLLARRASELALWTVK